MAVIGITGGTGFVGRHLCALLKDSGHDVVIFTRTPMKQHDVPHVHYAFWDPYAGKFDLVYLKTLDAVVHLAGAGIADKRWTKKRKEEIVHSRVHTTRFLVQQLREYGERCQTLISSSAIGYYGPDREGHSFFRETDAPYHDFLADTCQQWEAEVRQADDFLRTVIFRQGIVLGREDGMFPQLLRPASMGVLPIFGNGRQVISWIHVLDLCRMMLHAVERATIQGVYNAVTPHPVSQAQLMKTIAKLKGGIKVPAPIPAAVLKLMLGELSTELLKSCTVSADKTVLAGMAPEYDTVEKAARQIMKPD
ncbi:MAG: TIGR01777 family oxidoreductase [Flavipsychrobacter sp.]|nr:TIGR01777 family oxidoreductase [Flavipsychrobacter sp.]